MRETIEDYKSFADENAELTTNELLNALNNKFEATFYHHKGGIWLDCSDKGCKNLLIFQIKMLTENSNAL